MVAKKTFYHFFLTSVLRTVGMTECHCSSVVWIVPKCCYA